MISIHIRIQDTVPYKHLKHSQKLSNLANLGTRHETDRGIFILMAALHRFHGRNTNLQSGEGFRSAYGASDIHRRGWLRKDTLAEEESGTGHPRYDVRTPEHTREQTTSKTYRHCINTNVHRRRHGKDKAHGRLQLSVHSPVTRVYLSLRSFVESKVVCG